MADGMNSAMLAQLLGVTSGAAPLAGGALSLVQLLQGMNQQKKAKGMFPQIPPQLRMLQDEYRRKARNAEVGSMYSNTLNSARNLAGTSAQAVLQTGSPNSYNFAMRSAGSMLNDLLAGVQNKSMAYDQQAGVMTNKIADMQYASDANKYSTQMAQGIENQRFGMNGLAQMLTYVGMPKNGTPAPTAVAAATPPAAMINPSAPSYNEWSAPTPTQIPMMKPVLTMPNNTTNNTYSNNTPPNYMDWLLSQRQTINP